MRVQFQSRDAVWDNLTNVFLEDGFTDVNLGVPSLGSPSSVALARPTVGIPGSRVMVQLQVLFTDTLGFWTLHAEMRCAIHRWICSLRDVEESNATSNASCDAYLSAESDAAIIALN